MPRKLLKLEIRIIKGINTLVKENDGQPLTMGQILKGLRPTEGFVRDWRDVIHQVTEIVTWTDFGDPLRIVKSDLQ